MSKKIKTEQALDFAFDFQELSGKMTDHKEAIQMAAEKHKANIIKADDTTISFLDGTSVEWNGNGFTYHKGDK